MTQYVYDFDFDGVKVTPGINLGFSNEYSDGGDNPDYFYQFGPTAALSYKGIDILKLSVLNYKDNFSENKDHQLQLFNLSLGYQWK